MLRITLNQPWRSALSFRLGAESVAPMDFGGYTPELQNEFRAPRRRSQEKPRVWTMDYYDDTRSILVPDEVVVHYFGNWRAGTDPEAVEARVLPSFNNERERVANKWGGYMYSSRGTYTTAKIDVPDMPDVTINAVNSAGTTVGEWDFNPRSFWKFEELLDAEAESEMAEVLARRGKRASVKLDIADIPDDQLDALAKLLEKRKKLATAGVK